MAAADTARPPAEGPARASFDAFARRDVDAILAQWHPEGIQDWVPLGRVLRGHAEIRAQFEELFAAMPDLDVTVEGTVADDRHCVIRWRLRGTHTGGPLMGVDPTGRVAELRGVDVMEVEDGLVVRNTLYYDGAAWARGLGMLPPQDSSAERVMIGAFNGVTRLRRTLAGQG